ncbi:hypothetical protein K0651_01810 [Ornithinimicrobium sp. Arc0846-15]|nr:hypothetical protein [Ornithinimicrobium laminariae]
MTQSLTKRAQILTATFRRNHIPEFVAGVIIVSALLSGITMVVAPSAYDVGSFRVALAWAAAPVWGIAVILTSTAWALTILVARDVAWLGALGLGLIVAAWGMAIVIAVPTGAVPSAGIVYSAVAWTCCGLSFMYAGESVNEHRQKG